MAPKFPVGVGSTCQHWLMFVVVVAVNGALPADPLLEDNKALLAPLIAMLQSKPSTSITADFT